MARIRIARDLDALLRFEKVALRLQRNRRRKGSGRRHRLRRLAGETKRDEVSVLQDLTFEMKPGESLAVLSRRDMEQESVLRLASGTLLPDEGRVLRSASVLPMIKVAAVFGGGYTIRQNIYIVGGLLGLTVDEVREFLPSIAEFAGVDQILDKYLRNAPGGTRHRLAWALATTVPARAFAVHHALVVGEREFRQKCWTRMDSMREDGVSFLITSDSLKQFRRFCDRAILIDSGTLVAEGDVGSVVSQYRTLRKLSREEDSAIAPDEEDDRDSLG